MDLIARYLPYISLIFALVTAILSKYAALFVVIIVGIIIILALIERYRPKRISINGGKSTIVLEYGDILSKKDGIVIIPVDRNYNTTVDNVVISEGSLHGKFINTVFKDNESLVRHISTTLGHEPDKTKAFETQPAGRVVQIGVQNTTYYLLALSKLDENYKAQCTNGEYTEAIVGLMNHINTNFNDRVVYMPLIGGGLSNVFGSIDNTESLQILVSLIKLCQTSRVREMHIVIDRGFKNHASIYKVN